MDHYLKSIERRDRFFDSIADAIPQIVWRCRADGWREYSNARYALAVGVPVEASHGWGWLDFLHPEDVAEARHTWMRALRNPEPFSREYRMRNVRSGRYRWYLVRCQPLFDENGKLEGWSGTSTDVDESKRHETGLRMLTGTGRLLIGAHSKQEAYRATLRGIAPSFADFAAVFALGSDDALSLEASSSENAPDGFDGTSQWFAAQAPANGFVAPMLAGDRRIGQLAFFRSSSSPPFDSHEAAIFSEIAQRLAMTLRNVEAYEHERRVAESFQRAALPVRLPSSESVRFDAHYEAGRSEALVGGDWYDAVELMGGRVLVSIGDVSGSGLAAAVTMGLVRQSIRAAAQAVPDPAAILEAADRALRAENPDHIVTAFVGIFDVCTNDFWYASAGHPPALLRQPDGTVEELRTPGPPLGLRRRRHAASSETTRLLPDSLVVLYTDGLIEATRDILAGERQLREALADPALLDNAAPAEALRRILLPGGSHDDVAILTIRTRDQTLSAGTGLPSRAWRFASADAAAAAEARREFNELLRETPFDPGQLESAELIFGEMVGNAVKHTSGDIEARLSWTGASPVLHVLDEGPGYGHLGANPPNALSESGRGLFLIARLSEDFSVGRRPGGGSHSRAVLAPATHRGA